MADVIVEKDGNRSGLGLVVGIVAIVILVAAALFILPQLLNRNTTTNSVVPTPSVSVPTPTATTPGQ